MRLKFFAIACALLFITQISYSQPKVLVELFGNTGCVPCKEADENYQVYMNSHPTSGIVRINYHNNFPAPKDVFYPGTNSAVDFREGTSYYNFASAGDPWGFFNGSDGGFNEQGWESTTVIEAAKNIPQLTVTAYFANGLVHVHVANAASIGKSVRLNVALTESNILYNNTGAYGNPSVGHWDDIFRTMLPGPQGSQPFTPTGTDNLDYTLDPATAVTGGVNWNFQNMQAVAWLQDDQAPHHVEALGVASMANLAAVAGANSEDAAHIVLGSNPVVRASHIGFYLPQQAVAVLVIRDMSGREVLSFGGHSAASGTTSIEPDWTGVAAGVYLAQLEVSGRIVDQKKVIVVP